jgi:hypothetical protein
MPLAAFVATRDLVFTTATAFLHRCRGWLRCRFGLRSLSHCHARFVDGAVSFLGVVYDGDGQVGGRVTVQCPCGRIRGSPGASICLGVVGVAVVAPDLDYVTLFQSAYQVVKPDKEIRILLSLVRIQSPFPTLLLLLLLLLRDWGLSQQK